ncbi:MAG: SDR family oxidoreductase, partial [Burkholderiaceae bacterium]
MLAAGSLEGKRVLVTGGGSGLGAAMARRFIELGAKLVICGRRVEVLQSAAARWQQDLGAQVQIHRCDIRDAVQVEAMMDSIWQDRPLDVLVNNAAATFIARSEHLSHRAADAVLAPTLHGSMYCSLAAGRRWIEGKQQGLILSILSTSTITGRAFTVPSAMAKSAVLAMTKSLAVEWGRYGVRLLAIAPGSFPTPGASAQLMAGKRSQLRAESRIPLGRVGEHAELAELASFLLSDAAKFMTGEMVTIDGGAHLQSSGAEDLLTWT